MTVYLQNRVGLQAAGLVLRHSSCKSDSQNESRSACAYFPGDIPSFFLKLRIKFA